MPCDDITETLELHLDPHDRLVSYALRKRTCGAPVGQESLLLPWLRHRHQDEILQLHGHHVVERYGELPVAQEYMYFKHLTALQEGLRVLAGAVPGGPHAPCVAAEVAYDESGLQLTAHIAVPLLTERIKACGNCGSCGARKRKTPPPRRAPGLHGGGAIAMIGPVK